MAQQVLAGPIIQAGQSLSDALDCSAGSITRLTMPAAWTPANLSFQISSDGVAYSDLFTHRGRESLMPIVAGTTMVVVFGSTADDGSGPPDLRGAMWIKVRSGSRSYPVIQTAQRNFAITLDVP